MSEHGRDDGQPRRWRQDTGGPQARVLIYKLRLRTSSKGTQYLSGWTGSAKLLGFKDAERDEYNEVWSIYAVTPEPKRGRDDRDGD